jgi:hypothetical protein
MTATPLVARAGGLDSRATEAFLFPRQGAEGPTGRAAASGRSGGSPDSRLTQGWPHLFSSAPERSDVPAPSAVLVDIASDWPAVVELRRATSRHRVARVRSAASAIASELHVALAAAFLASHGRRRLDTSLALSAAATSEERLHCSLGEHCLDSESEQAAASFASRRFMQARAVLDSCGPAMVAARNWRIKTDHLCLVRSITIGGVVAVSGRQPSSSAATPSREPSSASALIQFEHSSSLFMADLAAGTPFLVALQRWSAVDMGTYSAHRRTFFPGGCAPRPVPTAWPRMEQHTLPGRGDEQPVAA